MILLPDSENCMIIVSFVSTQYQHNTDTILVDRAIANTAVALKAMPTRCKNEQLLG